MKRKLLLRCHLSNSFDELRAIWSPYVYGTATYMISSPLYSDLNLDYAFLCPACFVDVAMISMLKLWCIKKLRLQEQARESCLSMLFSSFHTYNLLIMFVYHSMLKASNKVDKKIKTLSSETKHRLFSPVRCSQTLLWALLWAQFRKSLPVHSV